jgi:O-antigen/teichoic acid export membrane protein
MFMPRIAKMIHDGKKDKELLPLMVRIGRIQCMIIGLLIVGFITLGESFIIHIWNKPDFSESYLCAVLMILPSFFYLPMQIAHTTLIVENKVKLQAYVFIIMGVVNVCLSFVLSKFYGALGASISIFVAYMLRTVLMAIIYHRVLHINIIKFAKESFLKITPFLLITALIGFAVQTFNPITSVYLSFAVNALVIVATFLLLMALFGFTQGEKQLFFGIFKKIKRK